MQGVEGTNRTAPVPCKLFIHAATVETIDATDTLLISAIFREMKMRKPFSARKARQTSQQKEEVTGL